MDLKGEEGSSILRSREYGQFLKSSGAKLKPSPPQPKVKALDASLRGQKIKAKLDVIPEEGDGSTRQPLIGGAS